DVSCQGAVFQAHDLLWDALSASLASGGPELEVTRAPVDPLEGAPDPTATTRFPGLVVEWVRV
ncbi:MAG: hypothetical protein KF809_09100, partial [Chloroflexi bacterium]|nr:hypothetical protein [Chloroflexota bacterium]